MNTNTPVANEDTVIDGAITEVKAADPALAVLNPTQYAVEVFQPFEDRLASLRRIAGRAKYDIKTKDGMAKAKELRATAVKIRTEADKAKAAAKRPIDESGKLILSHFKKIEEAAKLEEAKHDAVITAEEQRLAAEKQRKLDEERERVERLQGMVDAIRTFPQTVQGLPSDQLRDVLDEWANKSVSKAEYQDHFEDAVIALEGTVTELRGILTATLGREEVARKAEADRLELERLRTEQAERDRVAVEQKRQADEAAAAAAQQLADQQAAMQLQQDRMLRIQSIQQVGMRDGDMRALIDNLEYAQSLIVDAERYGDLVPMAQMAKDMAIAALQSKYNAQAAIELPLAWDEALDMEAERIDLEGKKVRMDMATGARYSTTTFKDNGEPIMLNKDGTRSVFCDLNDDIDVALIEADGTGEMIGTALVNTGAPADSIVTSEPSMHDPLGQRGIFRRPAAAVLRPTDAEIVESLAVYFGQSKPTVAAWLIGMDLEDLRAIASESAE